MQKILDPVTLLKLCMIIFLSFIVIGASALGFIEIFNHETVNSVVYFIVGGALIGSANMLGIHYGTTSAVKNLQTGAKSDE